MRSLNNLPLVSQFGSALWVPALLLDQPWVYFLSLSFVGAGLQGVAHEVTGQKGTLNQLTDAGYELAHTSFLSRAHALSKPAPPSYGPHAATVAALGDAGRRAVAAGAGAARLASALSCNILRGLELALRRQRVRGTERVSRNLPELTRVCVCCPVRYRSKSLLCHHVLGRATPNPRFERPGKATILKAMSSTSSYGSIEASEAPDQGPRRRRIVGAARSRSRLA